MALELPCLVAGNDRDSCYNDCFFSQEKMVVKETGKEYEQENETAIRLLGRV